MSTRIINVSFMYIYLPIEGNKQRISFLPLLCIHIFSNHTNSPKCFAPTKQREKKVAAGKSKLPLEFSSFLNEPERKRRRN